MSAADVFTAARNSLGSAAAVRSAQDADFRRRREGVLQVLADDDALMAVGTQDALVYLACELGPALQDDYRDALAMLTHGRAVDVWALLSKDTQDTLTELMPNGPGFVAQLMADIATQWRA